MPRGRKRISGKIHQLRGNAGKRARPPVEAITDLDDDPAAQAIRKAGELIAPPRWLRPFGTAMTLWKREAVPIIQQLRFIRPSDHHALALWCYWLAMFVKAAKALARSTTQKVRTISGVIFVRRHPATRDRYEAERHLQTLEAALGLNPKRRMEISAALAQGIGKPAPDQPTPGQGDNQAPATDALSLGDFWTAAPVQGNA